MKNSVVLMVIIATMLTGLVSAAINYSWNFDDGTAMGWTATSGGLPAVCEVHWYGFKDPPTNAVSNWGLGLNNNGKSSNQMKWEQNWLEITPNQSYKVTFDYSSIGEGSSIRLYFYDASSTPLGFQDVKDYDAWGWAPSLNTNGGAWTHKEQAIDAAYRSAKYVRIEVLAWATWGQTVFDNIMLDSGVIENYSWDFDDGTAMGWTETSGGLPAVCDVHWYGFKDPPANTISNFALGLNNNGKSNNQMKWVMAWKEITPNQPYKFAFDYSAIGEGSSVRLYFYNASAAYMGFQDVKDYDAWGWAPSLNTNGGAWTHKEVAIDAAYLSAKYVRIEALAWATWGLTMFDNITLDSAVTKKPLLNGDFETGGTTAALAGSWDLMGNCLRSGEMPRSGHYSMKTYDVSGGGGLTWSIVSQDVGGISLLPGTAVRLSVFAKGSGFNAGTENASIKLRLWQGATYTDSSFSFTPQSGWQNISILANAPSGIFTTKITAQLMYGSDKDGAGVIYWDDADIVYDTSNMAYAHNPCPADESTFVTDSNLYWSTGTNATSHDVYFGTNFNDVDNATRMQGDLDGDRQVGLGDLKILASQWLAADALLLANIDSAGSVTFQDFAKLAQNWGLTSYGTPYKGKQSGNTYSPGTLLYDTTYYWRIDEVNDTSGQKPLKGKVWSFKTRQINDIATEYFTWFTGGESDIYWSMLDTLGKIEGAPSLGLYSSYDQTVAAAHINQMLEHKVNVLSPVYLNKAGDHAVWNGLDPDAAFQSGVMKAANFGRIQFCISYDIDSRARMTSFCENGHQWGYPGGLDVLPGVQFTDPAVEGASDHFGPASFNFNLTDPANGKYIYDELMVYDFNNFAEKYFNQPNYYKINGACVVTIYGAERFNNGGTGNIDAGFGRALTRIRETIYNKYGYKLYIIGHFMTYGQAKRNWQDNFRTDGFYQHYDAVGSWNVYDRDSVFDDHLLTTYTAKSLEAHNKFRPEAFLATRNYRGWLSEPAKSAYGSSSTRLDFVPLLSYSFYDTNYWYSSVDDNSQITAQAQMIKGQRDLSAMAEENRTLVYQTAFNQWGEGQILEATITGTPIHPGKAGTMYLDVTRDVLGN